MTALPFSVTVSGVAATARRATSSTFAMSSASVPVRAVESGSASATSRSVNENASLGTSGPTPLWTYASLPASTSA